MITAGLLAASIIFPIPLTVHDAPVGMAPSAYQGTYYNPADEAYRKCVAQREGRFQYGTTGSNGYYVGTYQMTRALAKGAVWMMTREWRQEYGRETAQAMRDHLFTHDPTEWSREVWDQAFWTVLNWSDFRAGAHHWAGGRFTCTPGMISYGGPR